MPRNLASELPERIAPAMVDALAPIAAADDAARAAEGDALPADLSEDGLALAFTAAHRDTLRHCALLGGWQVYDGTRWERDHMRRPYSLARALVRATARDRSLEAKQAKSLRSAATVNAIVSLASSDPVHAIVQESFDADPWILNTPGGVVDLRTGQLRAGQPGDYCTKVTATAPGGDAPRWRQFLHEVTGGDEAVQAYLHRLAGYWLTGLTREHALVFVYGTGGNGKSVFLNTMLQMVGSYGMQAPMSLFEEKPHEGHPTELAMLRGARLVVATETEQGRRWAESRIKVMTGGDPITARFMRGDFFTYQPQFKPVIAGNHRPGFRNPDEAIRRRLHLVPFSQTFAAPDRDLTARLQAEAGGILAWAIEGCLQWQARGLDAPETVRLATSDYLEDQDVTGAWLEACTERVPGVFTASADLFASWQQWALQCGEKAIGQPRYLTERLTALGFQKAKRQQVRGLIGLRLLAQHEEGREGRDSTLSTPHARAHTHAHAQAGRLYAPPVSLVSRGGSGKVLVTWRGGDQVVLDANDRDLDLMREMIERVEPYQDAA